MGIFDRAKETLGGNKADETAGQPYAEPVGTRAGQGEPDTSPEDPGQPAPKGIDDPSASGGSPVDGETNR